MRLPAVLLALLLAAPAWADEPSPDPSERGTYSSWSASAIVGWGVDGALLALRPDVMFLRTGRGGWGLGAHALLGVVPSTGSDVTEGRLALGGGVNVLIPLGSPNFAHSQYFLQPSAGVYTGGIVNLGEHDDPEDRTYAPAAAAGVLFGLRRAGNVLAGSEVPMGIRVNGWYDLHDRSFAGMSVAFQVDLLATMVFAGMAR